MQEIRGKNAKSFVHACKIFSYIGAYCILLVFFFYCNCSSFIRFQSKISLCFWNNFLRVRWITTEKAVGDCWNVFVYLKSSIHFKEKCWHSELAPWRNPIKKHKLKGFPTTIVFSSLFRGFSIYEMSLLFRHLNPSFIYLVKRRIPFGTFSLLIVVVVWEWLWIV